MKLNYQKFIYKLNSRGYIERGPPGDMPVHLDSFMFKIPLLF